MKKILLGSIRPKIYTKGLGQKERRRSTSLGSSLDIFEKPPEPD
jgi:hypothetical protein